MELLPHVAVLPDRIFDVVGLSDGSYAAATLKGVYAVDAKLAVGPKLADSGGSLALLPDGRLVVNSSTMRVGTPGALEPIELGEYQRALHATPTGFIAVGSDRIVIEHDHTRATIHVGDRYVHVTPWRDRIAVADKTGLQLLDPTGNEVARSAEAYLTGEPIAIGDALVVPELRSLFIFDANAQKVGQLAFENSTALSYAGGVLVAPKPSYADDAKRMRIRLLALDREIWSIDVPRTRSIRVIGDHLVLVLDDGAWILDRTARVLAKLDDLGYVNDAAAFEDGIAITCARSIWWRRSGTTHLPYDGSLQFARTVPVGLATTEGEILHIWRTDLQGPEPVALTTDLPMHTPIIVDGTPMVIEGTNRFTLRARIYNTVHNRSPSYTAWRPVTTRDEAMPLLERLIARTFDGSLPTIPTSGEHYERIAALAQLPLAQTVDLVGRSLFSPASLDPELIAYASHLRRSFLGELATALDTRPRLLLAAIRARKLKLDAPRTVPTTYDYLGTFTTDGSLTVADPCYLGKKSPNVGFSFSLKLSALEGLWHVFVRGSADDPARNAELVAVHESAFAIHASEVAGTIGVDAGCAGIFDKACPKPNLDHGLDEGTVSGLGAVASSGSGDGMYGVFIGKQSGKVAKIRIVFIDDKPEIDRLNAQPPAGTGKPYRASATFALGDSIEHPKFGMGSVIRAGHDGKIDVRFADGVRTLVHAKK